MRVLFKTILIVAGSLFLIGGASNLNNKFQAERELSAIRIPVGLLLIRWATQIKTKTNASQ
jgi:hypothetical protein